MASTDQSGKARSAHRLAYIDGMRGIACILMFQTHCYDSWLSPQARAGSFFGWSQFASTLVACSFLFLAGISLSLAIDRMQARGASQKEIARTTIRRGIIILGLSLLFRVQEYLLGLWSAPWTDLLRVDILNIIGVSIALVGWFSWFVRDRFSRGISAAAIAVGISMLTPPLWTSWRPHWLPWFVESYINGVHTFSKPATFLFPVFPWTAFCFAGLAAGAWLGGEWARRRERTALALAAAGGVAFFGLAFFFDHLPVQLYREYDYWHTSPNFFLARLACLLVLLGLCYLWSRYDAKGWSFTRLVELGQSSLVVYWIHIEFVYGGLSILPRRSVGVLTASAGLLVITAVMMLVSANRIWLRDRGTGLLAWVREKTWPIRPEESAGE